MCGDPDRAQQRSTLHETACKLRGVLVPAGSMHVGDNANCGAQRRTILCLPGSFDNCVCSHTYGIFV